MIARGLLAGLGLVAAFGVAACDFGVRLSGTAPGASGPVAVVAHPTTSASASAAPDPLGPPPVLAKPSTFEPKAPEVFQGPNGLTVWLSTRPNLPLVSATFVAPYGAAADPEDRPGTMFVLADMLDEGAGKRSALEISDGISSLGANLSTYATADGTFAGVSSLRTNFDPAFEILCDVVTKPKLEAKDFTRVKKLYKNSLKKRLSDPDSVASAVTMRELYGDKAPYGHPVSGYLSKADAIDLAGLKTAYAKTVRPERLTLVVVGQITRPELEALLAKSFAAWKPKGEAAALPKLSPVLDGRPRIVLVDRPNAVQTVVVVAREGVAASDAQAPGLDLVNAALGGSFTSRLNSNLREEKHWTYGAGSTFTMTRGPGVFYARTSVETPFTGRAVKEILGELTKMAADGLATPELAKVKALDRADLVQSYETVSGTTGRLAALVAAGLPPGFDAAATRLRQSSTDADIARLAKEHVGPAGVTIVLVGDRANVEKQLAEEGLGTAEVVGPEGEPLGGRKDAPTKKAPAPKTTPPQKTR